MGGAAFRPRSRRVRCLLVLGSACALIPTHAALAGPDQVETLPPEWRMESDDDYSYYADYAPPAPVKGLVVHGYVADDSIEVEDGTVFLSAPKTCPDEITYKFPRAIPSGFPERATGEYWFYRAGDQALYLSRTWVYEVDSACQGVAREVSRIVRIVWFNGSATFIEQRDGGVTSLSTEKIAELGFYPIPARLVKIDDVDLRENQQSRLVKKSPSRMKGSRDKATGVMQTCFALSEAFIFLNECY